MHQITIAVGLLICGIMNTLGCASQHPPTAAKNISVQTAVKPKTAPGLIDPVHFEEIVGDDWQGWYHCNNKPPPPAIMHDASFVNLLTLLMILRVVPAGRIPTTRGVVNAIVLHQKEITKRLASIPGHLYLRPPRLRHLNAVEEALMPKESLEGMYGPGYPLIAESQQGGSGRNNVNLLMVVHPHGLGVFCVR